MNQHASVVARYLTDNGYQDVQLYGDDDERIALSFSGENADSVKVVIAFDDDDYEDETVAFRVWNITKYNENNAARVLAACNALNAQYRFVKFYLDESDHTITGALDTVVELSNAGPICERILIHVVSVVDSAYPDLMKAVWA